MQRHRIDSVQAASEMGEISGIHILHRLRTLVSWPAQLIKSHAKQRGIVWGGSTMPNSVHASKDAIAAACTGFGKSGGHNGLNDFQYIEK